MYLPGRSKDSSKSLTTSHHWNYVSFILNISSLVPSLQWVRRIKRLKKKNEIVALWQLKKNKTGKKHFSLFKAKYFQRNHLVAIRGTTHLVVVVVDGSTQMVLQNEKKPSTNSRPSSVQIQNVRRVCFVRLTGITLWVSQLQSGFCGDVRWHVRAVLSCCSALAAPPQNTGMLMNRAPGPCCVTHFKWARCCEA